MADHERDPRSRILAATVGCIGRTGLAKTTMEDAARAAGVSRATVYRHFPGGRDQLISGTITWEVGRFFADLGRQIDDAPDFPTRLERGLVFAHRAVADHAILQKVLDTEPDRLLSQLTLTGPLVLAVLRGYFEPLLEDELLADGLSAEAAADWLARNVLSFIVAAGGWDLTDPAEAGRLVRTQLLAGVLRRPQPPSPHA